LRTVSRTLMRYGGTAIIVLAVDGSLPPARKRDGAEGRFPIRMGVSGQQTEDRAKACGAFARQEHAEPVEDGTSPSRPIQRLSLV
jgi:hypothetical protein